MERNLKVSWYLKIYKTVLVVGDIKKVARILEYRSAILINSLDN